MREEKREEQREEKREDMRGERIRILPTLLRPSTGRDDEKWGQTCSSTIVLGSMLFSHASKLPLEPLEHASGTPCLLLPRRLCRCCIRSWRRTGRSTGPWRSAAPPSSSPWTPSAAAARGSRKKGGRVPESKSPRVQESKSPRGPIRSPLPLQACCSCAPCRTWASLPSPVSQHSVPLSDRYPSGFCDWRSPSL